MRDLLALPKADLHCHLEGSARPETIAELAAKYEMSVGDSQNFTDLASFLDRYDDARSVIKSIEDLERIAHEFVIDQAASGSVYCEPDWAPHFYTDLDGLLSESEEDKIEEVFTKVNAAMSAAAAQAGIEFGHDIGAQRDNPEMAAQIAAFAVAHKSRGVVSFGYGGDEASGPHAPLQAAAKIAVDGGILFAPHAGEVLGPQSIVEALAMGAHRIAHGVRSVEDKSVLKQLAENQIACDVTLSSNIRLGIYQDLAHHPLKVMVESGIPVTLNTDDSLFFGSSLLHEYELARSIGLSDDQLATIARDSIRFSGMKTENKTQRLAQIDDWLS